MGSYPGWWVILGDFNAVRFQEERRNTIFNRKCASNFNDFIFDNGLREYDMKGRKFMYLKDNDNKLSKIDRVLVDQELLLKWPGACLRALPRMFSDHCPLVLTCLDKNFGPKPFRFFNSWLERKDFDEVVLKEIANSNGVGDPDVRVSQKLKKIREALGTWKKEVLSKEGGTEMTIKEELEHLEEVAEGRELSKEEEWTRSECLKDLKETEGYKLKDIKQRARARWDLQGDQNTRFFHGYIESRRACNNITSLLINEVLITKPFMIKKDIMGFFKMAFEEKIKDRPKLICQNAKCLSEADTASLTVPFSKEEIKRAVFECGSDKALGPDGFKFNFIKRY
ncbi:putative Endonuclease/exonuclease/phosphatase superfamily [Helianthus annuus]|nr:putative Endonuclease/exonuclease/phosphatase superfamily [Helianthus annuus]